MKKRLLGSVWFWAALGGSAVGLESGTAHACGGFFCSTAQPVNQSAERIVFADNGDGTVTAVIQILYQGPSENFSWLLPISSVPEDGEIGVGSDFGFQRLQAATNPQYSLTTRVEGVCRSEGDGGRTVPTAGGGPSTNQDSAGEAGNPSGGVTVEATGVVGAFEWTVISLDPDLDDPADAATTWLDDSGYDVPPGAAALLGPYLEDGLYLLALRLTKGSDTGSIRPIVLRYDATLPMIPIKLTAVAANRDMGVMTWVLSEARAVPMNYLSLELNEARINWFNPGINYNEVVIDAADEAGGQGFVTEMAGPTSSLSGVIFGDYDEANWQSFRSGTYPSLSQLFTQAYYQYGSQSGFWDAVRATVTLPAGVSFEDFQLCPTCYSGIEMAPSEFMDALEEQVIFPLRAMQALLDEHPYVTRLYTTLSAEEMTVDPLFTFNPDLDDLSNAHTAERVIECNPGVYEFEANWRIELPQGGSIRGTPDDLGLWPTEATDSQPSNLRVIQAADSGSGMVVEDNSGEIRTLLRAYNDTVPGGKKSDSGGCALARAPSGTEAGGPFGLLGAGLGLALARRWRKRARPRSS